MLPIEVLTARDRVVDAVIRMRDGAKDELVLVNKLRTAQREVQASTGVEYDEASVGIRGAGVAVCHTKNL